ncbi:MAG TPA: thioredoxin domain-containing protein [Candidatus Acidoferrum sp.]|nr:thioredoxin domain-containing protein [Candidatus Acidoferrum sp.]
MKNTLKLALLTLFSLAAACAMAQQPAAATAASQAQKVEAFLRYYFALGPEVQITVATPTELGTSGLLEVPIEVKSSDGSDSLKMYLTKDGRYLLRGELSDLTTDPLAENIAKMQTANAPVLGDPNAPITLVEYSDFECPVCRNLHDALRGLLPNYPQVKVIFKDFPIDAIHPWARTAALAGRCAYQQNPKSFWKVYDLIYDNQELVSAANAWDKMQDFAGRAGLSKDAFKSCLASPQATGEVDASLANGKLLDVRATPTVFVNGRRVAAADPHTIQQYIDYELAQIKARKAAPKK